jgi:hypothetical protein
MNMSDGWFLQFGLRNRFETMKIVDHVSAFLLAMVLTRMSQQSSAIRFTSVTTGWPASLPMASQP